jgi:hypothetical protein
MTEAKTEIPDEALLSEDELNVGAINLLDELLGFVQGHDGFTGVGGKFNFFDEHFVYSGQYQSKRGKEEIDITRRGNGVLDHSVVRVDTLFLIIYSNLATGETMRGNSHGALRGTQGITRPQAPQDPAA